MDSKTFILFLLTASFKYLDLILETLPNSVARLQAVMVTYQVQLQPHLFRRRISRIQWGL